ncbi:putative lipoprotein [Sulfitobacter noctilucae]|nr:putative lipoprotein [Sulfitobacter noctilucae]
MAFAKDYIDLDWGDLVPDGQAAVPPFLQGLQHDNSTPSSQQPPSQGVRTDWNGEIVRLPGYIVPIEYSGTGVTAFMLVPFVGACVHVPPPPANQLVFVTTTMPYQTSGLFEAVNVIGMFGTASTSTQLADIAYALSADHIEPF